MSKGMRLTFAEIRIHVSSREDAEVYKILFCCMKSSIYECHVNFFIQILFQLNIHQAFGCRPLDLASLLQAALASAARYRM